MNLLQWLAEGFKQHPLRAAIFIVFFLATASGVVIYNAGDRPVLIPIAVVMSLAFVLLVVFLTIIASGKAPERLTTLLAYACAFYLIGALLIAMVLSVIWIVRVMFSDTIRDKYTDASIAVTAEQAWTALTPENAAIGRSESERIENGLNKVWEWMRDGLESLREYEDDDGMIKTDNTQRFVVVRSRNPFDKNYHDLSGAITVNARLRIEEGVLFLKSIESGRPTYRQMLCKCDITSDFNGANYELKSPNANEEIFAILRIRSQDNKDVSIDPSFYDIKVGVQQ